MQYSGKSLQQRYLASLLLIAGLLLIALLGYAWVSIDKERDSIRASIKAQSEQLKLSIDDAIDLVRGHAFAMRRAIEHGLVRPDLADNALANSLLENRREAGQAANKGGYSSQDADIGALHVSPATQIDPQTFKRDLAAAAAFLPVAGANHQWEKMFQWSYYYDAGERWFLIYPFMPQEELLRTTRAPDLAASLRVFFDADGTRPVELAGPRKNSRRDMVWTPPYEDAGGKGMMVTLLAPVYLADEYIGAVGTDVALETLDQVLRAHAPEAGRAMVVDSSGILLADAGGALKGAKGKVPFASVFPDADTDGDDWLKLPLANTSSTLLVHLDDASLGTLVTNEIKAYFGLALLLVLALLAVGFVQSRRYAVPALQLAEYVERCETEANPVPPAVPVAWKPSFDRAATHARQRRELLLQTQAQADELEHKVEERTAELQSANTTLEATVASLQKARHDLVRADRMGALGGMIAGVANELQGPLDQAKASANQFLGSLEAFKAQQARGLRKAELEAFVVQADSVGHQVGQDLGEAVELLGRFKQLALDQASEQTRRFSLAEIAENVLAVMRPALALRACTIDNRIPANIEMQAQAGTLGQILHHLLADAMERIAGAGAGARIELAAGLDSDAQGERILLTLRDNGTPSDATQWGLAIAQALAQEAFGGDIEVSVVDGGSTTTVRLPRPAA
jgi:signal transduction histidine kinase